MSNFINIYTNIYTYIIHVCQKWLKLKMIQETRVIDNKYCASFPTSRFQYLIGVPDSGNGR